MLIPLNLIPIRAKDDRILISIGDQIAKRNAFCACEPELAGPGANGAQGRNRTTDTAIFSRMLYQLSYLGTGGRAGGLLLASHGIKRGFRLIGGRSGQHILARKPPAQINLGAAA